MIKDFVSKVKKGEIDVVEHTKKVLAKIKKLNEEYNYFNVISEEEALKQAEEVQKNPKGKLCGVPVSVKDCIVVKDVESRAGSNILDGYVPVFDATAIEQVKKEGGIIIGKTAQDAFGFGSFSVNVGVNMKVPLNPVDKDRSCGGSSGGSGGITAIADFPHISLGESTGGSIESPASFCGVIGFCPTYGLVSRYGLMDYGNSLDKIGPMSKSIKDVALMLNVIAGFDDKDSTSVEKDKEDYEKYLKDDVKGLKIGVVSDFMGDEKCSPEIVGAIVDRNVVINTSPLHLATYYIIAMSEASTNLAKYCGMRYGKHGEMDEGFNDYFSKVRSENLNDESKRRIVVGTFARMSGFRDAYYIKAAKVRTMIIDEYKKAFEKYDVLVSPVTPYVAPKFSDIDKMTPLQNYMADIMTAGPNLAGIPHMSFPVGEDSQGMPVGMMVMAKHFAEKELIKVGTVLEDD